MMEFSSLGAFIQHVEGLSALVEAGQHEGLARAAAVIEKAAKARIGHYQPEVGPYPAWAPLAAATEAQKARMGFPSDAPLLASGAMRDNISTEMSGNEAVIGSPDDRAVYHEFGTSKMPPRPVFGPVAFNCAEEVGQLVGGAVIASLVGKPIST